jgi:hypothetical protein
MGKDEKNSFQACMCGLKPGFDPDNGGLGDTK